MVVGQIGGAEIPVETVGGGGVEGVNVRGRAEAAVVPTDQPLQWVVAGRGKPQLLAELTGVVVLGDRPGAESEPRVAGLRHRAGAREWPFGRRPEKSADVVLHRLGDVLSLVLLAIP